MKDVGIDKFGKNNILDDFYFHFMIQKFSRKMIYENFGLKQCEKCQVVFDLKESCPVCNK